jgi:cobalt/nickel transport system ATP-binding protein
MSGHLVEVSDLHFSYPDGQPALRGVSFRIGRGESVAVIGGNGAGKTTLLLHLNGVLRAGSGGVRIGDLPVATENLPAIRQTVGMIFQDPDDQLFMPTVFDDVAFGLRSRGLTESEIASRVERALATVGAGHLQARPPYRLSGGEKRVVAIAGVLAMRPAVLVMDEPSSGLDPAARRRLINLLAELELAKVVATHDLDLVLDLCQRVLVMHEGVLAGDGSPAEIFADTGLLQRCNLEPPLSQQRRRS